MKRGVMCGVMLACVVGFGCERDGEGGDGSTELVEPVLEKSKADKLDAVKVVADMQIDGEFAGEFTEDLQFFGHIFYTGKTGSVIDLEVTQKGSSRGLDTTLFLYGEKEPGDWQKLMVDDNDGWGDLSKLTDVDFRGNFRRYMAVVGTADGQGRGSYNLAITCTSGDCKARDAVPAECPETTLGWIDECMAELVFDSQGSITDAAQSCVELDASADYFDVDCNVGAFGTPQTWCAQGFTAFNDILYPACRAEVIGELGGTLVLDRGFTTGYLNGLGTCMTRP